jgi:hypothetical protein
MRRCDVRHRDLPSRGYYNSAGVTPISRSIMDLLLPGRRIAFTQLFKKLLSVWYVVSTCLRVLLSGHSEYIRSPYRDVSSDMKIGMLK